MNEDLWKFKFKKTKLENSEPRRSSSFPYISGDTFRSISRIVFDEIKEMHPAGNRTPHFTTPDLVESFLRSLEDEENFFDDFGKHPVLIIHNGDKQVTDEIFFRLKHFYSHIFSVNLPKSLFHEIGFSQIPIGLENAHWKRNGALQYFPDDLTEPWRNSRHYASKRLLLANFRTSTNAEVRAPLRKQLQGIDGVWQEPTSDPGSYFNSVRNSLFVISPEGNGKDCHRTWEAIYLGSIPVIKEDLLSPTLTTSLPILVVKEWNELLDLNEQEIRELAEMINEKSTRVSYMPYWIERIESMTH